MPDLRARLQDFFRDRVCLMGLGNPDHGDDAFGVRLAEQLAAAGVPGVVVAGTTPERCLVRVAEEGCDHLVFLDAVDFGGAPGAAVLFDAAAITARFPQVSTHKLSLGLLATWAAANGTTRAWVLGVQPASLRPAAALTPPVQAALDVLHELLCDAARESGCRPRETPVAPDPAASFKANEPEVILSAAKNPAGFGRPGPLGSFASLRMTAKG